MAEEIVRIIKVDTKNSDKSINDLRKEIKGLRSELDKAVVGSEEFESTLKQLTQAQKTYNSVQQQVRDMSRTNQQDMVRFASFARNLGKAYSSLNAAIGLFANGNEDVQRAMLRVQRTIQLVQGLDGIAGLVRDLPKIANAFKGWLSFLNPIEKQVDRIAKGINGISPQKLKAINEANRGGSGTPMSGSASVGGGVKEVNVQTQAMQQQTKVVTALNAARDELQGRILATKNQIDVETLSLEKQKTKLAEAKGQLEAYQKKQEALQMTYSQQKGNMSDLTAEVERLAKANKEAGNTTASVFDPAMKSWAKAHTQLRELKTEMDATSTSINTTKAQIEETKTTIDKLNASIAANEKSLKKDEARYDALTAKIAGTSSALTRLGATLKAVFSTVGWTLLISALVTAAYKLWDYVKGLQSAAKEQRKFNKEVSELTNKTASKQIVVLKELSYAYQKLGDDAKAKEKFLKQYADKIKETGIAITDVKKAEEILVKYTDNYVNAIMARAKAQAVEQKAIEFYEEYLNKRYELEQKIGQAGKDLMEPSVDPSRSSGSPDIDAAYEELGAQIEAINAKRKQLLSDLQKELANLTATSNEKLKQMFEEVAKEEAEYYKFFGNLKLGGGGGAKITEEVDKVSEKIQQLIEYYKQAEEILNDPNYELEEKYAQELDWTRKYYDAQIELAKGNAAEISKLEAERDKKLTDIRNKFENETLHNNYLKDVQEIEDRYSVQIDLAKEYNQDTIQLEEARERELAALRRKYNDDIIKSEEDRINNEVSYLQKQIEIIRDVYESEISKLREPREEDYQTNYYFLGAYAATSQTFKQIKEQRDAEIQYNNDSLEAFREMIGKENYELAKQLETVELTEKEKYNIRKRMSDNTKALSDAEKDTVVKNEEAKAKAQIKFQTAVQASVEVAGSLTSAIANMYKLQAQDEKKSAEEREKAAKKYKAWAKAQAIIDTFGAANAAFRAMADIPPSPVWGIAAAAAAIAAGMANVRAIEQESVVSSTSSSISGSSVSAPPAMQTPPIEYTRELVGDRELDKLNDPIKCYVLEAEIRSVADKVRVTEQNASF